MALILLFTNGENGFGDQNRFLVTKTLTTYYKSNMHIEQLFCNKYIKYNSRMQIFGFGCLEFSLIFKKSSRSSNNKTDEERHSIRTQVHVLDI